MTMTTGYFWEQAKRNALARLSVAQQFAIARAQAVQTLARLKAFDPDEPRDEGGKWTDGGGGGGSDKLEGYSDKAKLIDGVIHTSDVYDAVKALSEDREVELKQPKQISTLIKKLGEITKDMVDKGEKAPVYDLCKVTIKGTNLFCADTKGIPRVKMPQMDDDQTKAFVALLEKKGYAVSKGKEKSEHLRATQNQLDGAKVAKFYKRIRKDPDYKGDDKRLIISRDDYVLDGHHHWAAQIAADAKDNKLGDHKTKIYRIDIPIIKLYHEAMKFTGGKGGKDVGKAAAWAAIKAEAEQTLARLKAAWNEEDHPRAPDGEFTDGGGGGGAADKPAPADKPEPTLDPKVVDVGGDDWNKQTAARLEKEYQTVKPTMEALEKEAVGTTEEGGTGDDDEEEAPIFPEEWGMLTNDDQEEAETEYVAAHIYEYHQSEIENWGEESGPEDARNQVIDSFNEKRNKDPDTVDGEDVEWARDAINEVLDAHDEDGKPIPFDTKQLMNAIDMTGEGYGNNLTPKIEFDDDKLSQPAGFDPTQQTLPGMEPLQPHEMLTDDMREEIDKALQKAFEKRADSVFTSMDPPDYLKDSAEEYIKEGWANIDDNEKFKFVEDHTTILDKYKDASGNPLTTDLHLDKLPDKYDPLNDTSGEDYKRTQALARYLSRERTKHVLEDRDLPVPTDEKLRNIDNGLWNAWKGSSTSEDGMLLQLATAEELGGRLNAKTRSILDPEALRARAESEFKSIGGYAGVKALIRAKWETTQYLLDKSGHAELNLYRGMTLDKALVEKLFGKHAEAGRKVGEAFTHLPTMDVLRNGAASTTTSLSIANNWGGNSAGKVVLRSVVPRTAALSIPAYGINIKSEQEVVVAGTAWKGWDVWKGGAPGLTSTPLQKAA
jgi:hypothetical protein